MWQAISNKEETMRKKKRRTTGKGYGLGQVGLVVLLIMVVLLTVGLSVVSRSIGDVRLSRQEEEASRVFDAAEAGIEQGLLDISVGTFGSSSVTGIGDIDVNYTTAEVDRKLEINVVEGHAAQVNVSNSVGGEQVVINWSKETDCTDQSPASIVVTTYNYNGVSYSARREAFAACDNADNFSTAGVVDGDEGYFKKVPVSMVAGDQFVRVMAVYSDTDVKAEGVGVYELPVQYYTVRSVAESQMQEDVAETKVVEVSRTKPALPAIFDYVLFSGASLTK